MNQAETDVPEYFRTFIEDYFGELGREWLQVIPKIVSTFADEWHLEVGPPFDNLSYNYVVPVERADGSPAVLKVGVPEPEQRSEIFGLRQFDGRGIVRLLEYDIDHHVSLIERLTPGVMLSTLFPNRDDEATVIAGRLMREIATPAPDDTSAFASVEGWATRGMTGLREEFDGGTGPFPTSLVDRAEHLYRDLLASTSQQWLIHGDLHHMNILSSDAHDGWLAIDPKGVIGDRGYEVAPFLLNPNTEIHSIGDLGRLFDRRIRQFEEILEINRQRIHGWALAFSVLSAWWGYGTSERWQLTIALGQVLAELQF